MESVMRHFEWSGMCDPGVGFCTHETFSVGIYELIPKASGKGTKRGKVQVRVSGFISQGRDVYNLAAEIAKKLEAGTYSGPKNVKVKERA
jgi:hypothetical protein